MDKPLQPRINRAARDPQFAWRYISAQWRRAFGLNVSQITNMLWVGGEFRPMQWPLLQALGVQAVLSPPGRTYRPLSVRHQHRHCAPVEDFYAPTLEQLHEAIAFIQQAHQQQQPVLIHCHAGVGRAPLTAAAYLISQGMSAAVALQTIRDARPIIRLNARQITRLIEWEQHVDRQSLSPPLHRP